MNIPKRDNLKGALRRIRYQFPDYPESNLMYSVVERAVLDLQSRNEGYSAAKYLSGDIFHAEIIGIDSDWVRQTLRTAGVDLTQWMK